MASISAGLVLLVTEGSDRKEIKCWRPLSEDELDKRKLPELFRLGSLSEHSEHGWAVYTHFYGTVPANVEDKAIKKSRKLIQTNEKRECVISLAFHVDNSSTSDTDCDIDRVLSEIDVSVELENLNGIPRLDHGEADAIEGTWFVMPYQETSFNYVTAPGKQKIVFQNGSARKAECTLYTNTSPGVDREMYDRMIDELMSIYEHSAFSERSSQGIGVAFKPMAELYMDMLERIEKLLDIIAIMPEAELEEFEERVPMERLRRITNRTLMDRVLGHYSKLRTSSRRETYDIYEHRAIRSCLERIREIARHSEGLEKGATNSSETVEDEEDVKAIRGRIEDAKNIFYGEIQKRKNAAVVPPPNIQQRLWAQISPETTKLLLRRDRNSVSLEPGIRENCYYLSFGDDSVYRNGEKYYTQFPKIRVSTKNLLAGVFLGFVLEELRNKCGPYDLITLRGPAYMPLTVEMKPEDFEKKNPGKIWYPKREVFFSCIDTIEITNNTTGTTEKYTYLNFLDSILKDDKQVLKKTERIHVALSINDTELIAYYRYIRREQENADQGTWKKIIDKTDNMLNTYSFLQVDGRDTDLHPSNLFLNGRNYSEIYRILCDDRMGFVGVNIRSMDTRRIRAAQNIYERWGLYKMLWYFTEKMHFKLRGDSLSREISDYFAGEEKRKRDASKTFHLEKSLPGTTETIILSLTYQQYFRNGNDYRTPDFVWDITYKEKRCVFVLDTKYKDFKIQYKKAWLNLLFDVAYDKYLCLISDWEMDNESGGAEVLNEKLSGAFILHSYTGAEDEDYFYTDTAQSEDHKAKLSNYYGQNIRGLFINLDETRKAKFSDLDLKPENKRFTQSCRIGSISMMPGRMQYFMNLFRMIMEHFFDIDESVCWNCGGTDIERRPPISDSIGTTLCCRSCGEFWVVSHCSECQNHHPIRKHELNYYFEKIDSLDGKRKRTWMIYCPECGKSGGKKDMTSTPGEPLIREA